MAESQIEWTDATWNPVAGCSIITAGCTHCYAMQMARRLEAMGVEKYAGLTKKTGKRIVWNGLVREDVDALTIPLRWRKPRKIFVNSMSDLFHEGVSDNFISSVWRVMRDTPQHNYQILTKRPERLSELAPTLIGDVLPNVWLGTSIENAEVAYRIDCLRGIPAAIWRASTGRLSGEKAEGRLARSARSGLTRFMPSVERREQPFSSNNGGLGARTTRGAQRRLTDANTVGGLGTKCLVRGRLKIHTFKFERWRT